ncbi:hypothetical protein [Methanothermococcus okinawensis]|uniref:DUF5320 domain-containing protein n=1 Tax=Methanothermococcus okinawensis (strain DSM 14208 / JCM 11175 / IH1) TaxID=647113 RepID=F8AN68_METOI|nr:hypothetical protein [Methanothermococcus okinawensis]AEH06984.1 hypothetical protein Metok_1014 [Methanothermococcus okinawensis IH1]
MFGFGRGFGCRGFFGRRFFGRGCYAEDSYVARAPLSNDKYEYVGTCRCGLGPHAYYRDRETGRVVPAAAMVYGYNEPATVPETDLSDRLKYLEEEKKYLEEEIANLKKSLKKE